MRSTCKMDGCANYVVGRKLCRKHYSRWYKHGSPTGGKRAARKGEPLEWIRDVAVKYEGTDCLPWPYAKIGGGYGQVKFKGAKTPAHRVVCEVANGPPPSTEHESAHLCGNRICVNPNHLVWATRSENNSHRLMHGTHQLGAMNSQAKLTAEQVQKIRQEHGTHRDIAKIYGVSKSTITSIKAGKSWATAEQKHDAIQRMAREAWRDIEPR